MNRSRTLVAVALTAVAMVGCGKSPSSPSPGQTAVLRLTFPDPVVAAPSTDPRFALDATVPMVITETSGSSGTFRVVVTVTAWTAIPNSNYNEVTNFTGEFRIVPPR